MDYATTLVPLYGLAVKTVSSLRDDGIRLIVVHNKTQAKIHHHNGEFNTNCFCIVMIQRIFEGVHWQVGEEPMSLHSGIITKMDKVARHILKHTHDCTRVHITVGYGDPISAPIPYHIVTCIDLIRWVNVSALRSKGVAKNVHVCQDGTRTLVFEIVQ
jgi:hypothetical protein